MELGALLLEMTIIIHISWMMSWNVLNNVFKSWTIWSQSALLFTRMNCDALFSEIFWSTTFLMPGVFDVTTVENDAMKENFFFRV